MARAGATRKRPVVLCHASIHSAFPHLEFTGGHLPHSSRLVSRHEPLKDTMNRAVYERSMVHASFTPLNLASRTRRDLTGRANYSHELPYPWKIVRTSPGLPTPWAGPRFLRTRFAQLSPTSSKRVPGFPASLSVPRSSLLGRMDGRIADLSAYGMIGAPQAWIPPRPPLTNNRSRPRSFAAVAAWAIWFKSGGSSPEMPRIGQMYVAETIISFKLIT